MKRLLPAVFVLLLLGVHAVDARSARPSPTPTPTMAPSPSPIATPKEEAVVTHHTMKLDGRELAYTATAGTLLLYDDKHQPAASVFYVAYTADGLGPSAARPVTFLDNGGPGGSSALVHIGAFGPRIVQTTNAAATPPAPYTMVDNEDTILDKTDLVFIDAVGTGYSRIIGKGAPKDFYGVAADGKAFAQFIRRYISVNDRWNSPKYIGGESYATTRSAVVAKLLQDDGIELNGIILTGTVLDFATIAGSSQGNDLPFCMFLPTEAAVAAYYHKLPHQPADLKAFLQSVREFATGPYMAALAKGSALSASERDAIAQQMHADIGLPVDYLVRSNLRVQPQRFQKELLGDETRTVGRYDARFSEYDLDPMSSSARTDPASNAIFGAFTAALNQYARDELNYHSNDNYVFLSGDVNGQWDWKAGTAWGAAATNVEPDLREAMTRNPYLRVFVAAGLYDMATPFFGAEYAMRHLGIDPKLEANITFDYYPAGHMVYLDPAAHAQLRRDLDAFYR